MEQWKRAFRLATFELTASPLHLLTLYILSPILLLFIGLFMVSPILDAYFEKNYVGIDFLFILLFTLVPAWSRPNKFQLQQIDSDHDLWASPTLVMQLQLPIPKETLIKSRLVIYFFYSFPFQCLFLFLTYVLTPAINMTMSPGSYLAFSVIWLSFGVYVGYI